MLNMFRFVLNTETESAFGAERLFPVIVYAFINLYNVLINTDRQKSNIIDSVMNFRLFINVFACFEFQRGAATLSQSMYAAGNVSELTLYAIKENAKVYWWQASLSRPATETKLIKWLSRA